MISAQSTLSLPGSSKCLNIPRRTTPDIKKKRSVIENEQAIVSYFVAF
jgi:hypothetical protein